MGFEKGNYDVIAFASISLGPRMSTNKKKRKYIVSVNIASYNPTWSKLKITIDSILEQRDVKYQIVIADDGSKDDCFENVKRYFAEKKFEDYVLVKNEINRGTVENVYSSIMQSDAEYIKLLSPGDALYGFTVLKDWLCAMRENSWDISFSDCVCYRESKESGEEKASQNTLGGVIKIEFLKVKASPQNIICFEQGKDALKKSYLLEDDKAVGATAMVCRDVCMHYIDKIRGKIKYLEDYAWRLAVFEGKSVGWFDCASILYEYGTGVSTSVNELWNERLGKDRAIADQIIMREMDEQKKTRNVSRKSARFNRKLRSIYDLRNVNVHDGKKLEIRMKQIKYYLANPTFIRKKFQKKCDFRMFPIEYKDEFIKALLLEIAK